LGLGVSEDTAACGKDAEYAMGDEDVGESSDENAPQEDAAVTALRQVANHTTVRSVKETILTCMLIRTVRGPSPRRRRNVFSVLAIATGLMTLVRYWHTLALLLHLHP
jgi:hypothetical protein